MSVDHGPGPDSATAQRAAERTSSWRRLGRALLPGRRRARAQLIAAVLCAVLGFGAVVQVRHTAEADFSTLREPELVDLLDQLNRRAEELEVQIESLTAQRTELESSRGDREAAQEAARTRAITQGILAGTLPAQGSGVELTVYDPKGDVGALALYHLVEELRNAGAEAISLGDIRITATSWIAETVENGQTVVKVDGQAVAAPYEWRAIGDPRTMEVALNIPGGALAQVRSAGGSSEIQSQASLTITATKTLPDSEYASPVAE